MTWRRLMLLFWALVWLSLPFVRPEVVAAIVARFHRMGVFQSCLWGAVEMFMLALIVANEKPED